MSRRRVAVPICARCGKPLGAANGYDVDKCICNFFVRGFEVDEEYAVKGVPSVPDGVYLVTGTTDSTVLPLRVIPEFMGFRVIDDA